MSRNVQVDDFARIAMVGDPQVSPDGSRYACVVTRVNLPKNKYTSQIYVGMVHGDEPQPWTNSESNASSPRWSPDGTRLAFTSDRAKPLSQIYLMAAHGGEARALTSLVDEGAITEPVWSPNGAQIAFLFRATPASSTTKAVEERKEKELPSPVRRHTRLSYREDGFGYYDDSYWQIWTADARTGEARALTEGPFNCGPPVWSPDSARLAFISDRREDCDIPPGRDEIWLLSIETRELTRIESREGWKNSLAWSPDGERFAWISDSNPDEQWGGQNERLYVQDARGGPATDLTANCDIAMGHLTLSDVHAVGSGLVWSPDSRSIYGAMSSFGDTVLAVLPAQDANGTIATLTPPKHEMGGFSLSADGLVLAVTLGTSTMPHELYIASREGTGQPPWQRRSNFNAAWLTEVQVPEPRAVEITSGGGEVTVHGWLIPPADAEAGRRYPLILYVHGGPHLQYGNTLFHELQWLAAEGYGVLFTNPRGSKGYGEKHTLAIRGNWGEADYEDVMAAADFAAAQPWVDRERMAIMGGSYGGFMTAWAIGQTSRFRCAIADRLVSNLVSMSGTTDFAWSHGTSWRGNSWSEPQDLQRCSPLTYAGSVTTPVLIIHSDGDLRCPVGQAEEYFEALRLQRKTVEFIRYPAETSHGLSRNGPPNLRLDRLRQNLRWLDRWLRD
ncbi:MAG: S9 family peptidase [Armatimonadetes bacterium]|nr:S9 family peptidase [Armatimonadota bacterium]MDE2207338.1 S9 family peptidase [Armatimonadota bacterium]